MAGYVQQSTVELGVDADPAALGGAVTSALCGHWEHAGSCRWPHYTSTSSRDRVTVTRTVFACPPDDEATVRGRIETALGAGVLVNGPTGAARWRLIESGAAALDADDVPLVGRLTDSTS